MATNDPRFLSPWGERLAELGLEVWDVNVGRYVQIDLSRPRPEPEEFAEFGEFDTFTVLNPHDIPHGVWLYLNNKRPESRLPLHYVSRLETVADRFYLQHDNGWDGVTLHIILGGDLRALSVEPSNKGVVTVGGTIDVSDREGRKLGIVSVPGVATELTLEAVRALLETLEGKDFATENTLAGLASKDFATETKLEAVRALLEILASKDFATENTLAGLASKDFATETKLEAVRALLEILTSKDFATENTLAGLASKDFATETKLEAVRALLEILAGRDFATESTLSVLASKDFATEAKLEAVRALLGNLVDNDFATENTLSNIANTLANILEELQTQTGLLQQIADNTAGEDTAGEDSET